MPATVTLGGAAFGVPADQLAPADRLRALSPPNDPGKIDRLVRSIAGCGWVGPPLVATNGQLLNGAHRHAASMILGQPVPVVRVGLNPTGRALLPESNDVHDRLALLLMYGEDGQDAGSLAAACTLMRFESERKARE